MSEDLIKREDAIKAIKQWRDNDGGLFDVGLNQAIREIKRLPSADRPQGKWIEHWYPHFDVAGIECSICGKDVPYWGRNYDMPRYCPNCGAKMKGASNE